jgi:peroxiredoxin Q/BCP
MTTLEIGAKAPEIIAKNQKGETIKLSDNYQFLLGKGFEVLGVSIDSEQSHQKFIAKFELPFNLLADEDQKIVNDYGVWVEKNMYGKKYMGTARTTFVINEEGVIEHIIKKVDNKNASQQILDLYEAK